MKDRRSKKTFDTLKDEDKTILLCLLEKYTCIIDGVILFSEKRTKEQKTEESLINSLFKGEKYGS